MKIKYIKKVLGLVTIAITMFTGCDDWTEIESINNVDLNTTTKTEEYFAELRKWKSTPKLPQIFVWFDNWNGESTTGEFSLRGLPDSVTLVGHWGGGKMTPERKTDMEYVQKVKGTKVVRTILATTVGTSVEWKDIYDIGNSSDPEVVRPAIRVYAEALYDGIIENGYDGFDWDYEPTGFSKNYLWENKVQRTIFVEELSYWFGKGASDPNRDRDNRKPAKPGLLFVIDGNIPKIDKEWAIQYVDYWISQTYGVSTTSGIFDKVKRSIDSFDPWIQQGIVTPQEMANKLIITENFEKYASKGGGFLPMSKYIHKAKYKVGANTIEIDQQIGGCGIFRVGFDYNQGEGDYNGSPEYYYLRQGITNLYKNYRERQESSPGNKENE